MVRETTFCEDASRCVGVAGLRGVAVPVGIGPARGHPDEEYGVGEWRRLVGDRI